MERVSQSDILKYCVQQSIPFAIYKLPQQSVNVLVVGEVVKETGLDELFKVNKDIYALAPFSSLCDKAVYFQCDFVIQSDAEMAVFNQIKKIKSQNEIVRETAFCANYTDYEKQFQQLFAAIKSAKISKAILSRIKHVDGVSKIQAAKFYYTLSAAYPKAYTFMVYTPQSGLWTGASPELLFKAVQGKGTTMSLAGTVKNNNLASSVWGKKELDEQQIVTDFVTGVFGKYGVQDVQVTGPETIAAGKMLHLKTTYNFGSEQIASQLGSFISDLYPTPAVCGLPKNDSMQVIEAVEQHKRSYYAGFLGRIQPDDIGLFVNIRSMKFVNNGVDLYLGGGITAGSEAEKEWQETELKAETMWSVIKKVKARD